MRSSLTTTARRGITPGIALGAVLAVLLTVSPGGAPPARGQEAPPPPLRVEGDTLLLSLDEAVEIALERNLNLKIERYRHSEAVLDIREALGIYDLTLGSSVSTSETTQPTVSELEASSSEAQSWDVNLNQLTPYGGNALLEWQNSRRESNAPFVTVNPSYSSDLVLTFDQPLLRNFGRLATERGILVARANSDLSREAFASQVIDTVLAVEQAYWDLVESRAQLEVARESLALAQELHDRNKIRVEVGVLPPLDLVQSEAGIARREGDIIRNEARVGDNADRLRRLLNLPPGELWRLDVQPTTEAAVAPLTVDVDEAIATAFRERPEIRQQETVVRIREIDSEFFHNQKKPRLDLRLRYNLSGVGGDVLEEDPDTGDPITIPGDYNDALSQLTDADFDSWSATLTFSYPLQNRGARARSTSADLALERGRAELADLEQQILTEVRQAVRQLDAAAKQIEAAEASRRAQEKNLEAERKRFENGLSTSFQVLEIQEDLSTARSEEVTAITSYRAALAGYHQAVGRLLEENGVVLEVPGEPADRP